MTELQRKFGARATVPGPWSIRTAGGPTTRFRRAHRLAAAVLVGIGLGGAPGPAAAQQDVTALLLHDTAPAERGAYLFRIAGCAICHTDRVRGGPNLAGGRPFATDFGTVFAPNITPDRRFGIGTWTAADFTRVMRRGVRPNGSSLLPICPYPSFTRMTDRDLADLWAHLSTVPPVAQPRRPHQLEAAAGTRMLATAWQALFLNQGPLPENLDRSALWNRGRYLALAVGHCDSCHTPRTWLGEPDHDRELGGALRGPIGDRPPNLTPHPWALGRWSEGDIYYYLAFGVRPDGTMADGLMEEVIEHATAALTPVDRRAITVYLRLLPAVE